VLYRQSVLKAWRGPSGRNGPPQRDCSASDDLCATRLRPHHLHTTARGHGPFALYRIRMRGGSASPKADGREGTTSRSTVAQSEAGPRDWRPSSRSPSRSSSSSTARYPLHARLRATSLSRPMACALPSSARRYARRPEPPSVASRFYGSSQHLGSRSNRNLRQASLLPVTTNRAFLRSGEELTCHPRLRQWRCPRGPGQYPQALCLSQY